MLSSSFSTAVATKRRKRKRGANYCMTAPAMLCSGTSTSSSSSSCCCCCCRQQQQQQRLPPPPQQQQQQIQQHQRFCKGSVILALVFFCCILFIVSIHLNQASSLLNSALVALAEKTSNNAGGATAAAFASKTKTTISSSSTTTTKTTTTTATTPSFEMVVTLLAKNASSWSGRADPGHFLLHPHVEDIPVNIFLPAIGEEIIVPLSVTRPYSPNPFPYLENRTGPVNYFAIRDGRQTQEVTGYLHFIVNRYDSLPNVTIFLHSGPQRHGERILENIRHVIDHHHHQNHQNQAWTPEQIGFLHLNYEILVCKAVNRNKDWRRMWQAIGFNASHHPNHISLPCCAQFMVTRERIQLRPKSFYQQFLKEAYDRANTRNAYLLGLFAEYHWHVIFGEPPILSNDRQLVYYMFSNWSKAVLPNVLENPIPSLPLSDSMKPWYEKSVADPDSYFPKISVNSKEACPNGSKID